MWQPVHKSSGLTTSERRLAQICGKTFLQMWSYPNLFRESGKELCDLLVVCGNDLIIFSDKSCEMKDSGDAARDWVKWYRKAIEKSASQIFGAERWIRTYPDRIYLDPKCTRSFPLPLPSNGDMQVHRVVVARNAKARCQRELGGSGSLWIQPDLRESEHFGAPFHVGHVSANRGFVHVLDDVSLEVVLGELDTVTDLLRYLRKKEELILSGRLLVAMGEENLLAMYLCEVNSKGEHRFPLPPGKGQMVVPDGLWRDIRQKPEYRRKKRAEENSYLWDDLVNEFAGHIFDGTIIGPPDYTLADHEKLVRVLSLESRFERRDLVHSLGSHLANADTSKISYRVVRRSHRPDDEYVFGAFPFNGEDYEEYREMRRAYMRAYCLVLAWKRRQLKRVVGIVTEGRRRREDGASTDIILITPQEWTAELEEEARTLQETIGFHDRRKQRVTPFRSYEYPVGPRSQMFANDLPPGRNDRCPCGSGLKFKRCCGRGA